MSYLNPRYVRFAHIGDVKGPALLIPHDRPGDILLIGAGEDPLVAILAGRYAGEAFRQSRAENWEGMVIEHLSIAVDTTSLIASDNQGKRALTAVRRGETLGLFVQLREGSFPQTVTCEVADNLPPGSGDTRLGFTRWRLFIRDGDDDMELFAFDADTAVISPR